MANEPRFETYPRMKADVPIGVKPEPTGEYGWRFRAANGQITAIGGEGFTRRQDARRAASEFLATVTAGGVVMIDAED